MAFKSKKFAHEMQEALADGDSITQSVIAFARISKVSPKALAEALGDESANSLYRNDVTQELQTSYVKKAIDKEKKRDKDKT